MGEVRRHEGFNGITEERDTLGSQLGGPILWDESSSLVEQ